MKRLILTISDDDFAADLKLPFEATTSAWILGELLNQHLLHESTNGVYEGSAWEIEPGRPERAIDFGCPACLAHPGDPCNVPTQRGRRDVPWFHTSREDFVGH